MKTTLLSLVIFLALFSQAQIVNIPDATFKAALVNHTNSVGNPAQVIDTNGDGEIQVSEASAFSGTIYIYNKNVSDLTGIEAFTAITVLDGTGNQFSTLDVSNNIALTRLYCANGLVTNINVSNNIALTKLECYNNQLTSIDVSNNIALSILNCHNNQLTSIDVSYNTALEKLGCSENQFTTLDVSSNTVLTSLLCGDNQLSTLDVSYNLALEKLGCGGNQFTILDVSSNISLEYLHCPNGPLNRLCVKNGNNVNFSYFNASDNPNLYCIEVDDSDWSDENWSYADSQTFFSTDCSTNINEFQAIDFKVMPNPFSEQLELIFETSSKYQIRIIDLLGKEILSTNLTALKHSINTSSLSNGTYVLQVISEDGLSNKKLIKK